MIAQKDSTVKLSVDASIDKVLFFVTFAPKANGG